MYASHSHAIPLAHMYSHQYNLHIFFKEVEQIQSLNKIDIRETIFLQIRPLTETKGSHDMPTQMALLFKTKCISSEYYH